MDQKQIIMIVVVVAALGFGWWWYSKKEKKEGFVLANALDHMGTLDDSFESLAPQQRLPTADHFADMIVTGNEKEKRKNSKYEDTRKPMQRNAELFDSLMPKNTSSVTPYNMDVASPSTHNYMVQNRIYLRPPLLDTSLMAAIRGDLPIKYDPNTCLLQNQRYGNEVLAKGLYAPNKDYTIGAKNYWNTSIAGAGSSSGGSGARGGIIMDN